MQNNPISKALSLPLLPSVVLAALFLCTAIAAAFATPKFNALKTPPVLENVIPMHFPGWENRPNPYAQVSVNLFAQSISDAIYDQVLMRTYQDGAGNQVMLAVAYSAEQRQEIKIHRPEVCYPAQGFEVLGIHNHVFNIHGYAIPIKGKRLVFKKGNKVEAVSYWIRLGNIFPMSGLEMRVKILKEGLKGNIDDGVLVRVSTLIDDASAANAAYQIQEKFIADLIGGVAVATPNLLVPSPGQQTSLAVK